MSRLPDIQAAFQHYLLTGDATISTLVVGTERVPVATRLAIYGDGYRSRLIESLQSTFPVLAEVLGEDDFQTLAAAYVSAHESTFFSIRWYGDQLADFLRTDTRYSQAPLLAELARWEWAMAEAFDAADIEPLDMSFFAQVAPEDWAQLRFNWNPAAQVLGLEWNVPELWKAVTGDSEPPEPQYSVQPAQWLIWRQDLQIFFRPLSGEEAQVIAASRAGQTFGELCILLCDYHGEDDAPMRAAGFLRNWVQSGLLAR